MPSQAFEIALADSGLRESTELVGAAPPGPGQAEVLLHESPEGALTWHRPSELTVSTAAAGATAADGRVRRFVFDVVDRVVEVFETHARPHRLRAFRRLLENAPHLHGKVVLVQVAVPSREGIPLYEKLRKQVNGMVGELNGDFGTASWTPVVYIHRGIPRAELVALYAAADEKHDPTSCPVPPERLRTGRGIEVGHIFYFGTKYSEAMGATVMGPDGAEVPVEMGSYGIGVSRLVGALIEAFHDENGIAWPESVAPFKIGLVNLRPDDATTTSLVEELYGRLHALGVEVLLDDRDER